MPASPWLEGSAALFDTTPSEPVGSVVEPTAPTPPASGLPEAHRVDWLDGIRGLAAMFVVLHHIWLAAWPAFPRNTGPWWLGWMLYGHLAVAVFIVVSGFSLTLRPMRGGGSLPGGTRHFLRRRAWRILPPYWAALILSTIITAWLLQPSLGTSAIARSFVVHGLLIQDMVGSVAPNGTFWSIAVEWQIYFLFPLILWLARKTSLRTAVMCTVALVLVAQAVAGLGTPFNKIHHLTPQFLALFALGVLAVQLGQRDRAANLRRPLTVVGLVALGGVVLLALAQGSVWVTNRYFWIDMLFGGGIACLMAVMYGGAGALARRILASRVCLRLGLFSYSIYLIHGPILAVFDQRVFGPMHLAPLATFGLLLGVAVPVTLVLCYAFHLVFEAPFLRRRDLSTLRGLPILQALDPRRRVVGVGAPVPAAPAAADVISAGEAG